MKYDFDTVVDRRGSGSYKWDVAPHELPMWVADMDFKAAPEIIEALQQRVVHGVFGYGIVPEDWQKAYVSWWERRHHFSMDPEGLIFSTGVVPILSSLVRKLTTPNENVLIQTPVYNIFFNSIVNNGCRVLENPLIYDRQTGNYEVDFEDLEKKLADPQTTLMILCNPHNPVGKIWDRQTLARIGDLALRHGVRVISDEIHCDITAPGTEYCPFASVSEACASNSVTCIAPSKAFNLAGLQTAAAYVPEPFLRHKVNRALNTDEVAEPNAFAVCAAIAAFEKGGEWLDQLREYVFENRRIFTEYVKKELEALVVIPAQATYLLWVDVSSYCSDAGKLAAFVRKETGLYVTEGSEYGESGRTFLRINLACPRTMCMDGARRLVTGIRAYTTA